MRICESHYLTTPYLKSPFSEQWTQQSVSLLSTHCTNAITVRSIPHAQSKANSSCASKSKRYATSDPTTLPPPVPEKNPDHFNLAHTNLTPVPAQSCPSRQRRSKAATSMRFRIGTHDTRAPLTPVPSAVPHRVRRHYPLESSLLVRTHMCTWLAASYPLRHSSRPGHASRG